MAVFDTVFVSIVFAFVLAIIAKSWMRPAAPRAGYSRDPGVSVHRPIEGARVMIWGPPLFVSFFTAIAPSRFIYDRVQEFPDFLAYGLLISAAIELILYLIATRVFVGPVLETFVLRNEGTYSEELEDFYAREYQRFSRIPLVLAGVLGTVGMVALLLTVMD